MIWRSGGWTMTVLVVMMLAGVCSGRMAAAQGIVLPGVGPINRSMGGAGVAAAIDPAGAIHWNPASLSGLAGNEALMGVEFLHVRSHVESTLPANSLGAGIPPVDVSGRNISHMGVCPLPTVAVAWRSEACPAFTFGLGMFTIGGFGVNYEASPSNPVLTPQPPVGLGAANAYSRLNIMQIAPTAAVQLTDTIAVGLAPTVTVADLGLAPAYFAAPDDANGDGVPTYPDGTHSRMHYGMGFQAGVYYTPNCAWSFGASYKSPQWFEEFQFLSTDELGLPRRLTLSADFPMITSVGLAYRGVPGLVVASDVRYIDYDNASTFGDPARFNPDGSVAGLGWRSVFSVSVGGQYQLTDTLSLRLGYTATENSIPDAVAGFNLQSAALWQHGVMAGASLEVNSNIVLLIGYVHVFEKSIDSQLQTPLGPIPNSRVVHSVETDALVLGLSVRF